MASLLKFSTPFVVNASLTSFFVTADLDGCTTTSFKTGSVVLDNTSTLDTFLALMINLGSFTSAAPNFFRIWMLMSDTSVFEDSTTAPVSGTPVVAKGVTVGASAKVAIIPRIPILPTKIKFVFESQLGGTLPTGGNTIKGMTYSLTNNG